MLPSWRKYNIAEFKERGSNDTDMLNASGTNNDEQDVEPSAAENVVVAESEGMSAIDKCKPTSMIFSLGMLLS